MLEILEPYWATARAGVRKGDAISNGRSPLGWAEHGITVGPTQRPVGPLQNVAFCCLCEVHVERSWRWAGASHVLDLTAWKQNNNVPTGSIVCVSPSFFDCRYRHQGRYPCSPSRISAMQLCSASTESPASFRGSDLIACAQPPHRHAISSANECCCRCEGE